MRILKRNTTMVRSELESQLRLMLCHIFSPATDDIMTSIDDLVARSYIEKIGEYIIQ